MAIVLYEFGAFRLLAMHIYLNKGIWFYRRRIPDDVAKHHSGKNRELRYSLKTKDKAEAAKKADQETRKLDALWKLYRSGEIEYGSDVYHAATALLQAQGLNPGDAKRYPDNPLVSDFIDNIRTAVGVDPEHSPEVNDQIYRSNVSPVEGVAVDLLQGEKRPLFLSEALKEFQTLKREDSKGKPSKIRQNAVNQFITLFGDLPIDQYTRDNVNSYIGHLLEKGNKTTTVLRRTNSIKATIGKIIIEKDLGIRNIFENITIPNLGNDSNERIPFSIEELREIQSLCLQSDDEMRWAIALMSDTGMRVSEAIGLKSGDVFVDTPFPYATIQPSDTRGLKNKQSAREVPLVGASLWAARRALEHSQGGFLFPRYIDHSQSPPECKGTSASNGLNGWLRLKGFNKTCHSFRHSINDRLREIDTPSDIRDAIAGWKTRGTGAQYGSGFPLSIKQQYLSKIVLADLFPLDNTKAEQPANKKKRKWRRGRVE